MKMLKLIILLFSLLLVSSKAEDEKEKISKIQRQLATRRKLTFSNLGQCTCSYFDTWIRNATGYFGDTSSSNDAVFYSAASYFGVVSGGSQCYYCPSTYGCDTTFDNAVLTTLGTGLGPEGVTDFLDSNDDGGTLCGGARQTPCFVGICTPPTRVPTTNPTKNPTKLPTANPTNPTKNPTHLPTKNPTNPTKSPSLNPSRIPTVLPTANPTGPTKNPSHLPTSNPTQPTKNPSKLPTKNPTNPTRSPSKNPTQPTTFVPTKNPTQPTLSPAGSPLVPTVPPILGTVYKSSTGSLPSGSGFQIQANIFLAFGVWVFTMFFFH